MSTAPVTAAARESTSIRLRNLLIGASFAVILLIPKLLRIRRNPSSWLAFRVFLGVAGATLVIVPLSLLNSWLTAPAGLAMFLAAILLPPVKAISNVDAKAHELGALVVVNGGAYQHGKATAVPVQLFVGADHICALDSQLYLLLEIPSDQISSATALQNDDRWTLQIRWPDNTAEFSYDGVFAEHFARVAQSTVESVMRPPLPILSKSRAAGA
jgi:hypothetical protein